MSRPASASRRANLAVAAASALLTLFATAALQGCGEQEPEFDASVQHTPETLVQEFLVRYKNLPENRKALKSTRPSKEKEAPDVDEAGKSSRKEAAVKGAMLKESETLENVVATLEDRLGTIQGTPRAEAARKAVELIEKEPSVKEDDRRALVERLKKLN